jgi:hypothetical protein
VIEPPSLLTLFLQRESIAPLVCSSLVRRTVIERIGGWEEAFRTLYEDQVFYAKVCLKSPVIVTDECYCKYRKHPDSLCAMMKKTGQHNAARLTFLSWLNEYLLSQKIDNKELWEVLHRQLWPYHHPILDHLFRRARGRSRQMQGLIKRTAQRTLPDFVHRWLRPHWQNDAN